MLQEFGLNMDLDSGPVLGCHFVLIVCLFFFFFFLLFPCVFLTLQLPDVGILLCKQSRSWEVSGHSLLDPIQPLSAGLEQPSFEERLQITVDAREHPKGY